MTIEAKLWKRYLLMGPTFPKWVNLINVDKDRNGFQTLNLPNQGFDLKTEL